METAEILEKVQGIFCDVFDNEELLVTAETSPDDVEDWNSLSYIQLVVAIERNFGLKFTSKEILSWGNVGEMCKEIAKKMP